MDWKKGGAIIFISLCVGCAHAPGKRATDDRHATMNDALQQLNAQIVPPAQSRPLVTHIPGNWLGVKVRPLAQEANLPPVFKSGVTLKFPGRSNLRTIAERITMVTGIPVNLKPDVFLPLSAFVGGAGSRSGAGAAGPQAPEPGFGQPGNQPSPVSDDMELNFVNTPLRDVLNQIGSRFGINFTYQENEGITFSRLVTRTFTVKANPGDTSLSTSLGKGGNTAGGSTGVAFVSNGQVTMNSNFSVWTGMQSVLDTIKSPVGKYFINQATGSVTITDTREVMEVVQRYIDAENAVMTQQVGVRVELLAVSSADDDEFGINWNAIFTKLNGMVPDWKLNVVSPSSLTSTMTGAVGMSILTPPKEVNGTLGNFSGSQAMIDALKGYARVTNRQTFSAVTLNRQPAPLAKTTQTSYLARTVPGGNAGTGSSTLPGLEPGQVTTGFLSNIVPTVLDNKTVMLQFSIDSSELRSLNVISTGSGATLQSIQTPEIDAVQTVQRVALKSGGTLVLTGFEREVMRYDQRGLTQNIALGGSYVGHKVKETIVILITPVIVDGA